MYAQERRNHCINFERDGERPSAAELPQGLKPTRRCHLARLGFFREPKLFPIPGVARSPAIFPLPRLGVLDFSDGSSRWEFLPSDGETPQRNVCTQEQASGKLRCLDIGAHLREHSMPG